MKFHYTPGVWTSSYFLNVFFLSAVHKPLLYIGLVQILFIYIMGLLSHYPLGTVLCLEYSIVLWWKTGKKEQTVTIISSIPWLASPFSVCFIVPWTYWHAKCAVWKVYHFLPECQMAHHSRSWSEGPRPPGFLLASHVGLQWLYRGARGPPEKCCCEAHLLQPSNTYTTLTQPDTF